MRIFYFILYFLIFIAPIHAVDTTRYLKMYPKNFTVGGIELETMYDSSHSRAHQLSGSFNSKTDNTYNTYNTYISYSYSISHYSLHDTFSSFTKHRYSISPNYIDSTDNAYQARITLSYDYFLGAEKKLTDMRILTNLIIGTEARLVHLSGSYNWYSTQTYNSSFNVALFDHYSIYLKISL